MDSATSFSFIRSLEKFISNRLRAFVLIDGIVTAVNDDFTVDITVNEVAFTSVPTSVLKGSQATIFEVPVVGSHCLVKWRDGHRGLPQIDSFAVVDKYYIQPVSNLFISANQIQFNDGSNGGIPLSPSVSQRLNNIENFINNFVPIYNSHVHVLTLTSGTGTAAPTTSTETNTLTPTQPSDIENQNITQ